MTIEKALRMQIERLEIENETLKNKIASYEERYGELYFPIKWKLAPQQEAILAYLIKREKVSNENLLENLPIYWAKSESRGMIFVRVAICKLRKKIKPYNIEIRTLWGFGYELPTESRRIVLEAINERNNGSALEHHK